MKGAQQDTSRWTGNVARPLQQFLHTEAGSSSLLLLATIVALVWANSPLTDSYVDLWHTKASDRHRRSADITEDLQHWVNDGLMVFFFFVVGAGDPAGSSRWASCATAARPRSPRSPPLGGMVVPALLYVAINAGGEAAHGWGIVMATDIAFVLGALALLGPGLPSQVRVFLLTLAIVDDIGAIVVIAIFYSEGIDLVALAAPGGILVAIGAARPRPRLARPGLLRRGVRPLGRDGRVRRAPHDRGRPARAAHPRAPAAAQRDRAGDGAHRARSARTRRPRRHARRCSGWARRSRPTSDCRSCCTRGRATSSCRCSRSRTPASPLGGDAISRAVSSPITIGIVVGLVAGKTIGISLASFLAVRLGLGTAAARRDDAPRPRGGGAGGDRLHRLAVRHRPGVRRRGAARRGEGRRARRVGARGRARLAAVPACAVR